MRKPTFNEIWSKNYKLVEIINYTCYTDLEMEANCMASIANNMQRYRASSQQGSINST
jgi:ABC-2 type transport system ATP-binding protein